MRRVLLGCGVLMAFVAGKAIKVMRNGEAVQLKPGALVPEAATWKNLQKEITWGRIKVVPDDQVGPQSEPDPVVAQPPPEPEATEPEADDEAEEQPKKRGRKKKGFFGGD